MNTTDHNWMPHALSCMAQRFNANRTVEDFNILHAFYDQQHQNRWRYGWRGGYNRIRSNTLTPKEQTLLSAIERGMDAPGSGWLHELAPETHETAGVLGSLIKKGLVISHKEPPTAPGSPPAYWVELA